jgi:outer membrane protein assembly factor BamB
VRSRNRIGALLLVPAIALAGCESTPQHPSPPPKMVPDSAPTAGQQQTQRALGTLPGDWPTYHATLDRHGVVTGVPPAQRKLTVSGRHRLDAAVYASPIVVSHTIYAATENDSVYALDIGLHVLWRRHLGTPATARELPCGNIDPLGITGTPIYARGTIYVAVELGGPPRHELVALDARTGRVQWRRSLDLPGVETRAMQQRGALTVSGGRVWVAFGGLAGDCGGYKGRVVGVPVNGRGDLAVYTVPTTREAGIWTPPGPVVDADGTLLVAVGNGEAGAGDPYDDSDSVLRLSTAARKADLFAPTTWQADNASDLDLGSQGPALVGDWVFQAGKRPVAYVLDRRHFGGIGGQISATDLCTSFGGTAVVGATVYVPCTDGLRAVRIETSGQLRVLWHADSAITGSPVVGGGQVWSLDPVAGVLHALDERTGAPTAQVDVGETSRFATPALTGGSVVIPTLSGLTVVAGA